jgi:3'(2'), 5'-bisphosphate nucleotidase
LAHLLPGVPIVSEEQKVRPSALEAGFVLVDPLDGTREYLAGREEFTVNVAIISQGRPAVGIIAAPALGLVWRGVVGQGAQRLHLAAGAAPDRASGRCAIHTRRRPAAGFDAMVSRSHFDEETDAFLQRLPLVARKPCGSSLKLARIAEGSADLYGRLAPTCEWDVAAGHAILAAAGGIVTAPGGAELVYGHAPDFHVPGFIAGVTRRRKRVAPGLRVGHLRSSLTLINVYPGPVPRNAPLARYAASEASSNAPIRERRLEGPARNLLDRGTACGRAGHR